MKYKLSMILLMLLVFTLPLNASAAQSLFQPYATFPADHGQAVGIGDFNSDGLNDVAITSSFIQSTLMIFMQKADGTLAIPVTYDPGPRPESLSVGDLNNDGKDDIVITNFSANTISIFFQLPGGLLANRVSFPTSTGPDALAVGDLNGDGLDDVVVSHWNAPYIGVLTQNSSGALNTMVTYSSPQAGYDDIDIADVNNDGRQDVIKMNGQGYANPHLSVYLQNELGTLNSARSYSIGCDNCLANGIGTGDVTGDALTDIVVSYDGNITSSQLAVFSQAQDGSLLPAVSYPAYNIPDSVEVEDVNDDGLADVVTTQSGWSRVGVFLQQNGSLSPYTLYAAPGNAQGLDIGDLNNDGRPDLAIADYIQGLAVLYHTPPDTTPPTISVTAIKADTNPYIADTWTYQTVILKYTCSDSESGIASCPPDQVFSSEGITQQFTATATDRAGNSASVTFGPIKVDKTPPTVTMQILPNPVLLHGTATAVPNVTDEVSGINPNTLFCWTVDTTSVGTKPTRCYVSDNAGNMGAAEVEYQVIYDFVGFLSPVTDCMNNTCNSYTISSFNAGSPVSMKFQLKDANGNLVQTTKPPLWVTPINTDGRPYVILPEDYPYQTTGATYTWRKSQGMYQYDWSTKKYLSQTTWLVGVKLDDNKTYYVIVFLK